MSSSNDPEVSPHLYNKKDFDFEQFLKDMQLKGQPSLFFAICFLWLIGILLIPSTETPIEDPNKRKYIEGTVEAFLEDINMTEHIEEICRIRGVTTLARLHAVTEQEFYDMDIPTSDLKKIIKKVTKAKTKAVQQGEGKEIVESEADPVIRDCCKEESVNVNGKLDSDQTRETNAAGNNKEVEELKKKLINYEKLLEEERQRNKGLDTMLQEAQRLILFLQEKVQILEEEKKSHRERPLVRANVRKKGKKNKRAKQKTNDEEARGKQEGHNEELLSENNTEIEEEQDRSNQTMETVQSHIAETIEGKDGLDSPGEEENDDSLKYEYLLKTINILVLLTFNHLQIPLSCTC